jgi:energy-converting hydrogenase Eha subunit C
MPEASATEAGNVLIPTSINSNQRSQSRENGFSAVVATREYYCKGIVSDMTDPTADIGWVLYYARVGDKRRKNCTILSRLPI